jgi:hypothetical protein
MTASCCVECGEEGGIGLQTCKSCMLVKYCNTTCQRNHWAKHKQVCKLRAAELRDEALLKDPPAKEDCPICFLPMPVRIFTCTSLPDATISSVPIYDFANANEGLPDKDMELYYSCCGKSVCKGCVYSLSHSENDEKCPFCNSNRESNAAAGKKIQQITKRVDANDPASICRLAHYYLHGVGGFQQDHAKSTELYARAADLGYSMAHCYLGDVCFEGRDLKKAKFHYEAAAMAGHEVARFNVGSLEALSDNMEQAIKHWRIAASAGSYNAMHTLRNLFDRGFVSRESIDSTLKAYNNSCAELRSEARDAYIRVVTETI